MRVGVVDGLEMIDVGDRHAIAGLGVPKSLEQDVKPPPIAQTGERIFSSQALEMRRMLMQRVHLLLSRERPCTHLAPLGRAPDVEFEVLLVETQSLLEAAASGEGVRKLFCDLRTQTQRAGLVG